jgi:hypothetical protein
LNTTSTTTYTPLTNNNNDDDINDLAYISLKFLRNLVIQTKTFLKTIFKNRRWSAPIAKAKYTYEQANKDSLKKNSGSEKSLIKLLPCNKVKDNEFSIQLFKCDEY